MGYRNDKPSMFDDMPQHVKDSVMQECQEALFDSWIEGHLDEGMLIADYEMALMSSDNSVRQKFNEYWEIEKDEEFYLE